MKCILVLYSALILFSVNAFEPLENESNVLLRLKKDSSFVQTSRYFPEGIAVVRFKGNSYYIYQSGKFMEDISVFTNSDNTEYSFNHFSEGLTNVIWRYESKKGIGNEFICFYCDADGNKEIAEVFSYASRFKDGYAIVTLIDDSSQFQLFERNAIIDKNGNHIVEGIGVSRPYKNRVWMKNDYFWALIKLDRTGKTHTFLTGYDFAIVGDFVNDLCWVEDKETNKRAFINLEGNRITPWFDYATNFSEGLASFAINSKMGFVDTNGSVTIKPEFDYVSDFSEGYAAFKKQIDDHIEFWGYIDTSGKEVIPATYMYAFNFVNGYARVLTGKDGKMGFVNKKGDLIVDCAFDFAENFQEGLAAVRIGNKYGFVDTTGKLVIDFLYDDVISYPYDIENAGFSGGIAKVEIDSIQFFIDKNGNDVFNLLEKAKLK